MHGGQAFAFRVPNDQPQAVRCGNFRVKIPADMVPAE
jgi:hypothetical protein